MNGKQVILSSAYLAPIEYYTKLLAYDTAYIERYDHYMKQTFRNRCVIASAGGALALTIPTEKSDEGKCLMKDIRISDHGNWRHVHWNAFVAGYKHSPFFDYYADEFRGFFERKYTFLFDFNMELCQWVCEQMDDFRERIHPKHPYAETDPDFVPAVYYQVFDQKQGFIPNLSIADLLFNMGPESLIVLHSSYNC